MNAIHQLRDEHKAIKTTLTIMETMIKKLNEKPDPHLVGHLSQLVDFFRIFADKCHHGKEEELLFPALMELGVSKDGGPIGVMLAEHDEGRGYIRELTSGIDQLNHGDPDAVHRITLSAERYIDLLRRHIEKEDTVLFPLAENHLPKDILARLLEGFETIETEKIGAGKHEELHGLLDELHRLYH